MPQNKKGNKVVKCFPQFRRKSETGGSRTGSGPDFDSIPYQPTSTIQSYNTDDTFVDMRDMQAPEVKSRRRQFPLVNEKEGHHEEREEEEEPRINVLEGIKLFESSSAAAGEKPVFPTRQFSGTLMMLTPADSVEEITKTKIQVLREEREQELQSVKTEFNNRLASEEREEKEKAREESKKQLEHEQQLEAKWKLTEDVSTSEDVGATRSNLIRLASWSSGSKPVTPTPNPSLSHGDDSIAEVTPSIPIPPTKPPRPSQPNAVVLHNDDVFESSHNGVIDVMRMIGDVSASEFDVGSQLSHEEEIDVVLTQCQELLAECEKFPDFEVESKISIPELMAEERTCRTEKQFACDNDDNLVAFQGEDLVEEDEPSSSPVVKQDLVDLYMGGGGGVSTVSEFVLQEYTCEQESSRPESPVVLESPSVKQELEWGNLVSSRTQYLLNQYEEDVSKHKKHNLELDMPVNDAGSDGGPPSSISARTQNLLKQYELDYSASTSTNRRSSSTKLTNQKIVASQSETLSHQYEAERESMTSSVTSSSKRNSSTELLNSRIVASQKENLLNQYKLDMSAHAVKKTENNEKISSEVSEEGLSRGKSISKSIIEARKEELLRQYVLDLECSKKELEKLTAKSSSPIAIGSHMNRYMALTRGESVQHSSDEDDTQDGADESMYVDKHGVKIERSGGKIEIVKSSDSISSIKNRFGGPGVWKKSETENPHADVDPTKVKSALNVFKQSEVKKTETGTFNRPKSKKVRDPKELMELRKKATYGDEEELPQDGVVLKSVVIEKEELDTSIKHHALNVYKNLEKKEDNNLPLHKPKTKLISDTEAQATMEGIRTISSSTSEASDVNETVNDLTVDTVSGYGSAAPCSPSSTLSEDYLSDHKDESSREELKVATLNLDVSADLSIDDDISLVKCQSEMKTEIPNGNPIAETVDV